jgi:hypothetical protein
MIGDDDCSQGARHLARHGEVGRQPENVLEAMFVRLAAQWLARGRRRWGIR